MSRCGFDVPDAKDLRRHIREIEKVPFDGITFRFYGRRPDGKRVATYYAFTRERFEEWWMTEAYENLRNIVFARLTHNFINLIASPGDVDWSDDAGWDTLCHKVGLVAKAARIARCKGLLFDPEVYSAEGAHLW